MPLSTMLNRALGGGEGASLRGSRRPDLSARHLLQSLEVLEDRLTPSFPFDLGSAAQFGVLGLEHTAIDNQHVFINGNEGVSKRGILFNNRASTVSRNVNQFRDHQLFGNGQVGGSVITDPNIMSQADQDALSAAAAAAALAPTETFDRINHTTTVTGNGGLNVINIGGNITSSLILSGTANDVFVVNVNGNLLLHRHSVLGLAGDVTPDHVLYNFVRPHGRLVTGSHNVINGTLLAPCSSIDFRGTEVNGEIIAGGKFVLLRCGAHVNQIQFNPPPPSPPPSPPAVPGTISGTVFQDNNGDLVQDNGELGLSGVIVTLTGTDDLGNSVNLTTTPDDNGLYGFVNLLPGTYSITVSVLSGQNGTGVPGTVNGQTDGTGGPDTITGIVLGDSAGGINYNFAIAPLQ